MVKRKTRAAGLQSSLDFANMSWPPGMMQNGMGNPMGMMPMMMPMGMMPNGMGMPMGMMPCGGTPPSAQATTQMPCGSTPAMPMPPVVMDLTGSDPGSFTFPDDDSRLSTAFKALGCNWKFGVGRVCPRKFRASLCCACNPAEWPMLRLSQLSDEEIDLLLYILTGISPMTRPVDLGAGTKREAREAARLQSQVKARKQPERLRHLTEDLDNLGVVAMRLGYAPEWLSPDLRRQYNAARERAGMAQQSMWTGGIGDTPKKAALAIENPEAEAEPEPPVVTAPPAPKKRSAAEAFGARAKACPSKPVAQPAEPVENSPINVSWQVPALNMTRLTPRGIKKTAIHDDDDRNPKADPDDDDRDPKADPALAIENTMIENPALAIEGDEHDDEVGSTPPVPEMNFDWTDN